MVSTKSYSRLGVNLSPEQGHQFSLKESFQVLFLERDCFEYGIYLDVETIRSCITTKLVSTATIF